MPRLLSPLCPSPSLLSACVHARLPARFSALLQRDYDEFKVRVNALVSKHEEEPREGWRMPDGSPWPGNNRNDHVGMVQVRACGDGSGEDMRGLVCSIQW